MSDQVKSNQPSDAAEPKSKGDRSNSNLESINEPDSQKTWNRTQETHKLRT